MPPASRRQRRLEQHRTLARIQLTRVKPRQCTLCSVATDRFRLGQLLRIAHRRVPVVTLHVGALAGNRRYRNGVPRKRIAPHEAARIGADKVRLLGIDAGAFAVGDALVDGKCCRFATFCQFDSFFCSDQPRRAQLQIQRIHFQSINIRQAGAIVFGGEAGDVVCRFDRVLQRFGREIGGAGIAAPGMAFLSQVHGDAHALVLILLDGLDATLAHPYRQPAAFADLDRGARGPFFPRITQNVLRKLLQLLLAMNEYGVAHGSVFFE
ncbi:peptidase U62 modulator of DNA gyrase domain protein [Collimonas arenae]|uniref:Peptidase U62 modulator of DNA gyrase domain protein n=1 Tax=Collimonas arenae TaxID=279058 RepID=A0A127QGN8_9BURK|nr:peptidase U62 modulator of DNA gyrase domain protein [Collimonas arenae]